MIVPNDAQLYTLKWLMVNLKKKKEKRKHQGEINTLKHTTSVLPLRLEQKLQAGFLGAQQARPCPKRIGHSLGLLAKLLQGH